MTNIGLPAKKNVAIVDEFKTKTIDLDGDNVPDISHGHLVETYLKASNPNVKVDRFQVDYNDPKKQNFNNKDVLNAFEKVYQKIENGEKYDAVNLSMGSNYDISNLQKTVNKGINNKNINQFKPQIKDYVSKNLPEVNKNISSLEKITSKGVPVYVSAGNDKASHYNLLGLANGTKAVGSSDHKGNVSGFSANNNDISNFEKGEYFLRTTKDSNGNINGMDVNNDGKPDIPVSILSDSKAKKGPLFGSGPIKDVSTVNGTSFSAPVAIARFIEALSRVSSLSNGEQVFGPR